jgi:ribosomal-protein-alanine N-acetyltransferase
MNAADCARLHHAGFHGMSRPWSAQEIADLMAQPRITCVALGQVGFALLRIIPPEAEILTLTIHPDAQGQGQGRNLLQNCLDAARMKGAGEIWLEVMADNIAACRLYISAGFAITGRRANYYTKPDGTKVDALVFRLFLARHGVQPFGLSQNCG